MQNIADCQSGDVRDNCGDHSISCLRRGSQVLSTRRSCRLATMYTRKFNLRLRSSDYYAWLDVRKKTTSSDNSMDSRAWSRDDKLHRRPMTFLKSDCFCLNHHSSNTVPVVQSNPYAARRFTECIARWNWRIVPRNGYPQVGQVVDGSIRLRTPLAFQFDRKTQKALISMAKEQEGKE